MSMHVCINQSDKCVWLVKGLIVQPFLESLHDSFLPSAFQHCFAQERLCKCELSVILPHADDNLSVTRFTPARLKHTSETTGVGFTMQRV